MNVNNPCDAFLSTKTRQPTLQNEIKIGVLDNCPVIIRGLQSIFSTADDLTFKGGYTNGKDLIREIGEISFDVLLTELVVKDSTIEQLIGIIKKKQLSTKLLVFSVNDSIYSTRDVMRQGASGYILKTNTEEEILRAIRSVHSGELYIEPIIKESIFQKALLNKKPVTAQPKLTRREREIVQLLASNYSNKEISKKLFLSQRTVENHRANMLQKFKVKNSASLIKRAIELDLI